jgi:hypothetical protein
MIFKNTHKSGNISSAAALSALGVGISFLMLGLSLISYRTNLKNMREGTALLFAHSAAALLKEDILTNFQRYSDTINDVSWRDCRTTAPSVTEFIKILNNPSQYDPSPPRPPKCSQVNFSFNNFQLASESLKNVGQTTNLQLGQLKNTPLQPGGSSKLVQFKTNLTINSFNTNPDRNLLEGTITLQSNDSTSKTIRLAIDISRTVNAPRNDPSAKICRSIAGSVCSSDSLLSQSDITFLNSSGQIMKLGADKSISDIGITVDLRVVSVKNLLGSQKTEYYTESFCLPSSPGSSVPWIIDAASDSNGNSYYLTTHGMLLDSTGTNKWAQINPTYVSIAFDNIYWLLLRSDGTILKTTNIETLENLQEVIQIPQAVMLTTGAGPNPC